MRFRHVVLIAALIAAPARAQEIAPPAEGCHYEIALADAEARKLDVSMACAGDGPHTISTYRHISDAHVSDLRAAPGSTSVRAVR